MFFYVLLCSVTTWYCCIFLATQTHAHINEHTPRNTHTTARARTTLARHSPASSEKKGETAKTGLHSSLNWLSSYSLSLRPLEGHDVVVAWALKSYWSLGSPPSSTLCAQRTARVCVCERANVNGCCMLTACVCGFLIERKSKRAWVDVSFGQPPLDAQWSKKADIVPFLREDLLQKSVDLFQTQYHFNKTKSVIFQKKIYYIILKLKNAPTYYNSIFKSQ